MHGLPDAKADSNDAALVDLPGAPICGVVLPFTFGSAVVAVQPA